MKSFEYKKYRINKIVDFLKYATTLGVLCFFVVRAPDQAAQIATTIGAFILGGTKFGTRLSR